MYAHALGRTGLAVSQLGFGASPLGGEFGAIDEAEGLRAVKHAINRGVTYFDVAPYYGRTRAEEVLGRALEGQRDGVVLSTKVGRYGPREFDFSAARVESSINESLGRLRTDRLDIAIIHDIEFGSLIQIVDETLPALATAKKAGKVRAIGVSGLPLAALRRIIESADIDVVLSYCHYHLADTTLVDALAETVAELNIGLISASPLAMGLLTQAGPPAWHPAPDALKQTCRKAAELCARSGVDLATLALRFAVDAPFVSTTLVGMSSRAEVDRNLDALTQTFDPQLLEKLKQILAPVQGLTWPSGLPENSA